MKPLLTVLYEDSKIGKEYPLHHLVLRLVEDDVNGQTWRLRKVVEDNPKNGIDKVLADVRITSLIAGAGRVFALIDRDAIIKHIRQNARSGEPRLAANATDDEITAAVLRTSDAPDKLRVFFLQPNMEGLIAAIERCAPGQWAAEIGSAKGKDRLARDFLLSEVAKAPMTAVRACIRAHQPGLDSLAKAIAGVLPAESLT